MTSYGSSTEPRSPYYGTATFSTLTNSQTPFSPSGDSYSYASHSDTPVASSDSEGASSARNMRRVNLSPSGSRHDPYSDSYTYSDENSIETAEVEAALNELDDELDNTEEALTEWSRGPSSYVSGSYTGTTPSYTSTNLTPYSVAERDRRVLSTISERTENIASRPTSHLLAGAQRPSNPTPDARYSLHRAHSPALSHARSYTDPGSERQPAPTGRRFGDLIAFFEDKTTPLSEASYSQSAPNLASTPGHGYGTTTGYSSRPSSPAKSKAGSTISSASGISDSSLLAPPKAPNSTSSRGIGSSSYLTPSEYTNTFTNTFTNSGSNTFTTTRNSAQTSSIAPNSSLRRPQTSPRSPLTSVRNIVAAWKERGPSGKSPHKEATTTGEGLFSLRRRAERGENRSRDAALSGKASFENNGRPSPPKSVRSGNSIIPPPFDVAELGSIARNSQEPLRIGLLWYLNVHSDPPFRWQRCEALLYPNMLLLSWIAVGGGRGVVTLDILNCTEVRSVPSPTHSSAREDVGTIAAQAQVTEKGSPPLLELLCPFQLLYSDGVERLAAESARERVRWVSAIWEVIDRPISLPNRSEMGSPTGSIRTIRSVTSTTSVSGSGSSSTQFIPPLHTIPDLDLGSLSGRSSPLSRTPSFSVRHTRTTDDGAVSNQAFLYPGDPRVIGPSRSSSLRRTSSMTDLDEEFATAVNRARNARPGLGFGLSLVGGSLLGDGSPVTVSSGPRLGADVRVTPPPSARGGKPRPYSEISDDAFFSAGSRTSTSDPNTSSSNFHSVTSTSSSGQDPTTTGLVTDGTIFGFTSGGSNTEIVPSTLSYRRTESNSLLGDSHDGSYSYSYTPTSPSRTSLSRSTEVRRRRVRDHTTTETSDKENSDSYTHWTTTQSTLSSFTRSRSATPTPAPSTRFAVLEDLSRSSSGSESYETAPTPSTASFKSMPRIPSESDYSTAELCKTESDYVTAKRCETATPSTASFKSLPTIPSESDFITAEVCKTETCTEYITAEICGSESEVDSSLHVDVAVEVEMPFNPPLVVPSSAPSLASEEQLEQELEVEHAEVEVLVEEIEEGSEDAFELFPQDIPPPVSGRSPSLTASESLENGAGVGYAPRSVVETGTISVSFPSTITPGSDRLPLPSTTTVSSLTESSPLVPSEALTPADVDVAELSISTPSVGESMWAPETDISYNSSALRPSPSVHSAQFQEVETSYDTSFMRPSPLTSLGLLTPITESISASVASAPVRLQALPPSISSPASGSSPIAVPASAESSSLSRTASSVSTGSIKLSPELEQAALKDDRAISEPSTEPSLLSSHRTLTPLPLPPLPAPLLVPFLAMPSPAMVPLPTSPIPSMSAASVSMSVSLSTPQNNVPSIHSDIDTIHTQERAETLSYDINRLIQHIDELDQIRGQESQEISENVRAIRGELYELSNYLHRREVHEHVAYEEIPPPVPYKDQSVGGSSIILGSDASSSVSSGSVALRPTPIHFDPRLPPTRVPIPLTPPPMRPHSPSSISSGTSFLYSYHSDDESLRSSESYVEVQPSAPSSPSWSSTLSSPASPASPSSSPSPPSDLLPTTISSSSQSPGPSLSQTSSSPSPGPSLLRTSPPHTLPPPPSPTPSSASSRTVRQEGITLVTLRELLEQLRQQTTALSDGQVSTNHILDELRQQRPAPQDNVEIYERLRNMESLLERVIEQTQVIRETHVHHRTADSQTTRPLPVHVDTSGSVAESDSDALADLESLRIRWELLNRGRREIQMPTPVRTGPSLDDQLLELLGVPPPQPPAPLQGPPPLIPFTYQPAPRMPRSRSASPVSFLDRPHTVPYMGGRDEPVQRPHRVRPPRTGRPPVAAEMFDTSNLRPSTGAANSRPERVPQVPPAFPVIGDLYGRPPERVPTAPPDLGSAEGPRLLRSWYRRRADPPSGVPLPPIVSGEHQGTQGGPTYVPMPPGPTVVQVPLFDTLMEILREHRLAQLATVDQQRELMRYMSGLNQWLERDVSDRQAELRGVSARVDQLRNDLLQFGMGFRTEGDMAMPRPSTEPFVPRHTEPFIVPPPPSVQGAVVPGGVVPPFVPGFVPLTGHMPMPVPMVPGPPVVPQGPVQFSAQAYDRTPTPPHSPVIPSPILMPGASRHTRPVVPDFSGFPQPQHQDPYRYEAPAHTEGVIPSPPSPRSDLSVRIIPEPQPHQPVSNIFIHPSSRGGSPSSTQQSFQDHGYVVPSERQPYTEGDPRSQQQQPIAVLPTERPHYDERVPGYQGPIIINAPAVPPPVLAGVPTIPVAASPLSRAGELHHSVAGTHAPVSMADTPQPPIIINPPAGVPPPPVLAGAPTVVVAGTRRSRSSSRGTADIPPHVVVARSSSHSPSPPHGYAPTPIHLITSEGGGHPGAPYIVVQSPSQQYGDPGYIPSDSHPILVPPSRRGTRSRSYSPRHSDHYRYSRSPSPSGRHGRGYHGSRSRSYSPRHGSQRSHARTHGEGRGRDAGRSRRRHGSRSISSERDGGRGGTHRSGRPRGSERDAGAGSRRHRSRSVSRSGSSERDGGRSGTHRSRHPRGSERDAGAGSRRHRSRSVSRSGSSERDEGRSGTHRSRHPRGSERDAGAGSRRHRSRSVSRSDSSERDGGRSGTHRSRHPRGSERDAGAGSRRHGSRSVSPERGGVRRPCRSRRHRSRAPSDVSELDDGRSRGDRPRGHGRDAARSAAGRSTAGRTRPSRSHTPSQVFERDGDHDHDRHDPERDTVRSRPHRRPSPPGFSEHDRDTPVLHRLPPTGHGDGVSRRPSTHHSPPASPLQPTIVRVGDPPERIHPHPATPIIVHSPPPRSHLQHDPQTPRSRLADEIRSVPGSGTYIPYLPSESGHRAPAPSIREHTLGHEHALPHPQRAGTTHGVTPDVVLGDASVRRPPSEIMIPVPPPHGPHEPAFEEALQEHQQRLEDAERQLTDVAHQALENEDRREDVFRKNEEERERVFLGNENRRELESQQRADDIFRHLEERVAGMPLPPPPEVEPAPSIIETLHSAAQDAATRHSSEILDTVRLEREEMAREREIAEAERQRLHTEMELERNHLDAERVARIEALENELARVRVELENEKEGRLTEEAEARNRERQETSERDEAVRNQLGDITNIVQEQRDFCDREKQLMDERWAQKEDRRGRKDQQMDDLLGMVSRLMQDREDEKARQEEERAAAQGKPGIENVIEELQRQNVELRDLLTSLSDTWRIDSGRQHEDTIREVRATAQEQVPFNVQGYLDEFSKALASEVRMLLGEVGKLREERRNMQHEIGYLLSTRAKYAPGGEFDPEWKPPSAGPPAEAPPPDPPAPPEEHPPTRPAWRTIPQRSRKIRKRQETAPPPQPVAPDPRQQVTSWATWQPDPGLVPSPSSMEPNLVVPDRSSPGLFGPRSPRSSYQ